MMAFNQNENNKIIESFLLGLGRNVVDDKKLKIKIQKKKDKYFASKRRSSIHFRREITSKSMMKLLSVWSVTVDHLTWPPHTRTYFEMQKWDVLRTRDRTVRRRTGLSFKTYRHV